MGILRFCFFGLQYEADPNILNMIPITEEREAVLLAVRVVQERKNSIIDHDYKGRTVKVNKFNHPVLYFRNLNDGNLCWTDLDWNIYALLITGKIIDQNNRVILERPLEAGEYLYVDEQGKIYNRYETPHPRMKKQVNLTASTKIMVKDGLNWLNGGLLEVRNTTSIQIGEVVKAKIISAKSKGNWSTKTVNCTIQINPKKWFIIVRVPENPPINPGAYNVRIYAAEFNYIVQPDKLRAMIYANLGNGDISLGVLAFDCNILPIGRSINARVVYDPSKYKEILFSQN